MHLFHPVPGWVAVTFVLSLLYGLAQFRARQVRAARLIILPSVATLLTLAGVMSGALSDGFGLLAWLVGVVVTVWLGKLIKTPRGVRYSYQTKRIFVPGSWVPLLLLLLIYAILYSVNNVIASPYMPIDNNFFSIVVGLVYGMICGVFLARMLAFWRVKRRQISKLIS